MIDLYEKYFINLCNRQVVINKYEAEELVKRDGFNFNDMELIADSLYFNKGNEVIYSIDLSNYLDYEMANDFKNYFKFFIDRENWLELYFP